MSAPVVTVELRDECAREWRHLKNDTFSDHMATEHLAQFVLSHREAAQAEAQAEIAALVRAVEMLRSYGCPRCGGDCGSANPPVIACPMQVAQEALAKAGAQ